MEKVTIGNATLYLGDCMEGISNFPSFDGIVTDPPYGINYQHSGNDARLKGMSLAKSISKTYKIHGDDVTFDPSFVLSLKKPIVIWGADHMRKALPDGGRFLTWDKSLGMTARDSFVDAEFAWTSEKTQRTAGNVFRYLWKGIASDKVGRSDCNGTCIRYHVSEKPEPLMRWCIEHLRLRPGSTVLDPYMGAGSTALAALSLGMMFVGCEIDKEHFDTACKRISAAQQQLKLGFV